MRRNVNSMNALQIGCFTVFTKLNIYRFYYVYLLNLDINLLDAGRNKRLSQKKIYGGEIFPTSAYANDYDTFLEYFQKDKNLNNRGINLIQVENWSFSKGNREQGTGKSIRFGIWE